MVLPPNLGLSYRALWGQGHSLDGPWGSPLESTWVPRALANPRPHLLAHPPKQCPSPSCVLGLRDGDWWPPLCSGPGLPGALRGADLVCNGLWSLEAAQSISCQRKEDRSWAVGRSHLGADDRSVCFLFSCLTLCRAWTPARNNLLLPVFLLPLF